MRCNKSCLCPLMKGKIGRLNEPSVRRRVQRIWRKFPFAHRFGILWPAFVEPFQAFKLREGFLTRPVGLVRWNSGLMQSSVSLSQQKPRRENFKVNIPEALLMRGCSGGQRGKVPQRHRLFGRFLALQRHKLDVISSACLIFN
jgi:hypothetical protein